MEKRFLVSIEQLRHVCDPSVFKFKDTSELTPLNDFIGQERATKALMFGLEMEVSGYNIFAQGPNHVGRTSVIKAHIRRSIKEQRISPKKTLRDFCYVANIESPDKPILLIFKKGEGREFKEYVAGILEGLKAEVPAVLQSQEYLGRKKEIIAKYEEEVNRITADFNDRVNKEFGFTVIQAPAYGGNPSIAKILPLSLRVPEDGSPVQPMSQLEFAQLPKELKDEIKKKESEINLLQEKSNFELRELHEGFQDDIRALEDKLIARVIGGIFKTKKYRGNQKALKLLGSLKKFALKNIDLFLPQSNQMMAVSPFGGMMAGQPNKNGNGQFLAFEVNLFVDNSEAKEIPVIVENDPTFFNLLGKVDKAIAFGTYTTDHTKIQAGSFCRADGGYLILNIMDLARAHTWMVLEKTLKCGAVKIEEPMEHLGYVPATLSPEPIPVNVKVIVVGDPHIYHELQEYDEDFSSNFKAEVEFDSEMPLSPQTLDGYAGFVAQCCKRENLLPFDPTGVAKIVEFGSRLANHRNQEKLTAKFGLIKNLVVESDYWAKKAGSSVVGAEHVRKAIEEKRTRINLRETKVQEMIHQGYLLIETKGQKVGQINGLAVMQIGDFRFGMPGKITAKTFKGSSGVISIDRQVGMAGPIHNKGIDILVGYFNAKYGQEKRLEFSASICFEQNYSGLEGDSASAAELYALISSLASLPIKQELAVTGSINQNGEIQPIGGANEKIEGFFDICKERGLAGQGVVIPWQNVQDLMLREEVVEAVRREQFAIYQVKTVDEGMELLMAKSTQEIHKLVSRRLSGAANKKIGWLGKLAKRGKKV